jgi:putative hemin transport protein
MTLAQRWAELTEGSPRIRPVDAAKILGVSEAELVETKLGAGAQRLRPDWPALFGGLPGCGPLMALTRNASCVHERTGVYNPPQLYGQMGLVVGEDIDLRLFLSRWASAFAVEVPHGRGSLASIQIFDRSGLAVHKIYCRAESDVEAWTALVAALAVDAPDSALEITPAQLQEDRPDEDIDAPGLRAGWEALKDTHDFFGLLQRFGVGRLQALRLGGASLSREVEVGAVDRIFKGAAESGLPVMVFVGNPGCLQIHTGPVQRLVPMEGWLNVMDPHFNLHLRVSDIASAWWVRKPTVDGDVHSLELFDAQAQLIAQIFGKRKPGIPEDPGWTLLLDGASVSR